MGHYLRAAFWSRWNVPGLGRVPVNVLAMVGFAILGFGEPAFWLLGLGLEAGFLTLLATNPRFQKVVNGASRGVGESAAQDRRQELVGKLSRPARERLNALEEKCARTLQIYRESQAESYVIDGNQDALDQLTWVYLKLLVARDHLQATQSQTRPAEIERRVADLEKSLTGKMSSSLQESQQATLNILKQRLANFARCKQTLAEVDSDLERIEAQIDLVLDSASLHGPGEVLSGSIEFASLRLVGDVDYGDAGDAVSALDAVYGTKAGAQREG